MTRYIDALDGIRGLGILFVVTAHYLGGEAAYPWISFSWIFVQMFFVQSGFLITRLLLDDRESRLGPYLKRFYWRRALRIFPIYFAYLLLFAVIYLATHKPVEFPERAGLLFTYTYNWGRFIPDFGRHDRYFGPFWSLAVEEQFYLIWPLIIYLVRGRHLKRLLVGIMVATPFFRYALASMLLKSGCNDEMVGLVTYTFTFSQFDAFAWGAAIPVFGLTDSIRRPRVWAARAVAIALAIGLTSVFVLRWRGVNVPLTSFGYAVAHLGNYQHVWSYTIIDMMFMFVIVYLVSPDYRGVFNRSVLVSVGKVVYGLYILHSVVIQAVHYLNERFIHNQLLAYALACFLSWVAAWISYNFFEKRFLELKDFWVKRRMRAAKTLMPTEP